MVALIMAKAARNISLFAALWSIFLLLHSFGVEHIVGNFDLSEVVSSQNTINGELVRGYAQSHATSILEVDILRVDNKLGRARGTYISFSVNNAIALQRYSDDLYWVPMMAFDARRSREIVLQVGLTYVVHLTGPEGLGALPGLIDAIPINEMPLSERQSMMERLIRNEAADSFEHGNIPLPLGMIHSYAEQYVRVEDSNGLQDIAKHGFSEEAVRQYILSKFEISLVRCDSTKNPPGQSRLLSDPVCAVVLNCLVGDAIPGETMVIDHRSYIDAIGQGKLRKSGNRNLMSILMPPYYYIVCTASHSGDTSRPRKLLAAIRLLKRDDHLIRDVHSAVHSALLK